MTLRFLGPCGFNTLHVHPWSSEFKIVVEGRLMAEFTAEDGARTVRNEVEGLQGTVFPRGRCIRSGILGVGTRCLCRGLRMRIRVFGEFFFLFFS